MRYHGRLAPPDVPRQRKGETELNRTKDHRQYLVGTWTFTKADEAQVTPSFRIQPGASAATPQVATHACAVYYGVREPDSNSFLLLHNDLDRSALSRQRLLPDGTFKEEGRWSSGGIGGSYIAFDQTGHYFAIANAHTGWAIFRNGVVPQQIAALTHQGSGPHPRQSRSHPHCILFSPDNRWIYATDMGSDQVLAFAFDARSGSVGEKIIAWQAPAGSGPRHLLCHRGRIYLLNELGNTLVVLQPLHDGRLSTLHVHVTLPDDFNGDSHTAHLALSSDGNTLFASNRGHDSIACCRLDGKGNITSTSWVASEGKWPWFFLVTPEDDLLVANTLSDSLVHLALMPEGHYQPVKTLHLARPVFISALP